MQIQIGSPLADSGDQLSGFAHILVHMKTLRACCPYSEGSISTISLFKQVFCSVQYKYIVDGSLRYDPSLGAIWDEDDNVNNILEVQEFVPENLDSLTGFDPPPSPPERQVSLHHPLARLRTFCAIYHCLSTVQHLACSSPRRAEFQLSMWVFVSPDL